MKRAIRTWNLPTSSQIYLREEICQCFVCGLMLKYTVRNFSNFLEKKKKKTQAEVYRGEVATIVKRSSTVNFLRSEETRDRAIRFSVSRYQFFFFFIFLNFILCFVSFCALVCGSEFVSQQKEEKIKRLARTFLSNLTSRFSSMVSRLFVRHSRMDVFLFLFNFFFRLGFWSTHKEAIKVLDAIIPYLIRWMVFLSNEGEKPNNRLFVETN